MSDASKRALPVVPIRTDPLLLRERDRIDPVAYGLVNVTSPCIDLPSCEGYFFHNGLHPTTVARARLAEAALSVLQERQEPITRPLP